MRALAWCALFVFVLLTFAAAPAGATAQSAPEGSYVLVSADAQQSTIQSAISTATSGLGRDARNEQRSWLEELARPALRIQIARVGTSVSVSSSQGIELRSPADATRVAIKGGWQLDQRLVEGALEQRIERAGIVQLYRYALSADRRTLSIAVHITADSLLSPIAYTLSYRRE